MPRVEDVMLEGAHRLYQGSLMQRAEDVKALDVDRPHLSFVQQRGEMVMLHAHLSLMPGVEDVMLKGIHLLHQGSLAESMISQGTDRPHLSFL